MTANELLNAFSRLDPVVRGSLEARHKDPRHRFVSALIDEVQARQHSEMTIRPEPVPTRRVARCP